MEYLSSNEFVVWPLEKLIKNLNDESMIPDRVISITFDDAYENIYTNAWPLLKEKGYPFTLFIATDLIGKRGYLSWNQIREMHTAGLSVANHTKSHPHLIRKIDNENLSNWKRRITEEITGAQEIINNELPNALALRFLAYPYGEYNNDTLTLVKSLGYTGFGQQSGAAGHETSLLILPRFPLSGVYANFSNFVTKVHTLAMPLMTSELLDPELEQDNTKPTLRLSFTHQRYRLNQLACYGPSEKMTLKKEAPLVFLAQSISDLPIGRSRYNCTMPVNEPITNNGKAMTQRFYWFSQLWITKQEDGSWYPEP
ncbi:MAG: polysaccharide deacetylase family protein [Pseudomonadales bacterium]|nr:polysaccharide deacetylase family protein [Pseudomonadales bacterium]